MLTNEKDTIIIKSFYSNDLANEKGAIKNLPFKIPAGFELFIDDQRVGIIDYLGKILWINKNVDDQSRFAIAAASSAIIFRRIQN